MPNENKNEAQDIDAVEAKEPEGELPREEATRSQRPSAQSKQANGNNKAFIWIAAIVAVIIVIIVAICIGMNTAKSVIELDSGAREGQADYKSPEEIQAELDRKVEEGMFNISIASVIQFEDGESEGTAYIENVPANHYYMKCKITMDQTGETLYESGVLKPDSHIANIKLNRALAKGSYACTATFVAIDQNTLSEIGQAAAKVTINVLN